MTVAAFHCVSTIFTLLFQVFISSIVSANRRAAQLHLCFSYVLDFSNDNEIKQNEVQEVYQRGSCLCRTMWKEASLAQINSETKLLGDFSRKRLTELTFLYHSLQNIHVVLLRHAAERGELGLGDKLQELEERKRML